MENIQENNQLSIINNHLRVSALQIAHFMQNKPNFKKVKMNVSDLLTRTYEKKDTWWSGKNKPNSNPIQTQSNPIKANKMPKQTQYKANTNPISKVRNVQKNPREIPNKNIGTGVELNIIEFRGELTESQNKLWCQQNGQNGRSGPFRGILLKAS